MECCTQTRADPPGMRRALPMRVPGTAVFFFRFATTAIAAFVTRPAWAEPCPAPPPVAVAVLTPNGDAHLITRGATTACWWSIDEDGDARVVHRFDLARSSPEAMWWDEHRQAVCIEVAGADGTRRQRLFPQGES